MGRLPRLAYAYLLAAWTAFQTGDVPAQAAYAERGMQALGGVNNVEVETGVRSMYALASFERASGSDRVHAVSDFHQIWQDTDAAEEVSPALISQATPQEVRICLLTGHTWWAEEAADRVQRQLPDSSEAATVWAQILAARGSTREALKILRPALDGELSSHAPTTEVTAHVLAATLEASLDNPHRAFNALETALEWAAPNAFRRAFLDAWEDLEPILRANRGRFGAAEEFVSDLFGSQHHQGRRPRAVLNNTLTEKEFAVLRDLPAMLTLSEIAEARGVSENTVKTHVRSIYQKLGANSRAAAVREARERGII
ncbi:helix-turn-helix transcriptional regulator [Nocardioides alcanivorans]|uniref:helix-turn-helix transcriptional regulator n=1 Tax=Nocardioides alcanivorans TaxID=2897352 RepID=UPI001F17C0A5|nr:LuxR C-terminal-related transcriptional regulator [Nocardioides alcanivorans]